PELSLPELVAEQVKTRPDAIAIRTGDGEVSYRQLAEQAGQVAARLGGTHGPQLVAIYAPRGPALISALLGTLQAGASFCVLDPANPPGWLRRQLAAARPDILLDRESTRLNSRHT